VATGKIILISGASSAGKTAISRAVQERLAEPFWHFSIDLLRDGGVLPLARIQSGEFPWPRLRPAFFDGFHRAVEAIAAAGNNLVVEHIVETEEWMARLVRLLSPFDVYFVGLHCALPELERRERLRGDRRRGEARRDFESIHGFATYDLELDSMQPVDRNATILIGAWGTRRRPSAFDRMAATLR
jgi:chloramphenicol 3-O phosphotransferase